MEGIHIIAGLAQARANDRQNAKHCECLILTGIQLDTSSTLWKLFHYFTLISTRKKQQSFYLTNLVQQYLDHSTLYIDIKRLQIYLITRVSMQYRQLLHEWAWYFHEP